MGPIPQTPREFEVLAAVWEHDPSLVISNFLSNTEDPVVTTAMSLANLLYEERISSDNLKFLGLDEDKLIDILSAVASTADIVLGLQVRRALRNFELQIDEIIKSHPNQLDVERRNQFRIELADFANTNNIYDLRIAFRLMCEEGRNPLNSTTSPNTKPGGTNHEKK